MVDINKIIERQKTRDLIQVTPNGDGTMDLKAPRGVLLDPTFDPSKLKLINKNSREAKGTEFDDSTALEETTAGFQKQAALFAIAARSFGLLNDEDVADWVAQHSTRLQNAQRHAPEYMRVFQKDYADAEGLVEAMGVVLKHPKAIGRLTLTQVPNAAAPLALGFGGSIAASPIPFVGSILGFTTGAFIGTSVVEIGAWIDQKIQETGADITNPEEVLKVLQDKKFMAEVSAEAKRKGFTTAGVDALFNAFGGFFLSRVSKAASLAKKAGAAASDVAVQSFGEFAGETVGFKAATGKFNNKEALLEAVSSFVQSTGETAIGASARKVKPSEGKKVTVEEKETKKVPEVKQEVKAKTGVKPEGVEAVVSKGEQVTKKPAPELVEIKGLAEEVVPLSTTVKLKDQVVLGRIAKIKSDIKTIDQQIKNLDKLLTSAERKDVDVKLQSELENKILDLLDKRSELRAQEITEETELENVPVELKSNVVAALQAKVAQEKIKGIEAGIKKGKQLARAEMLDVKQALTRLIKQSDIAPNDKINEIVKIPQTIQKFEKRLPQIRERLAELEARFNRKNLKLAIAKVLKKGKAKSLAIDFSKQIKQFESADIKNMSNDELQKLLDTIRELTIAGKETLAAAKLEKEERIEKDAKILLFGSKKPEDVGFVGDPLNKDTSQAERNQNTLTKVMMVARQKLAAITPMDAWINSLDSLIASSYRGANYTIFKKSIDIAHNNFNKLRAQFQDTTLELALETHKLSPRSFSRIGVWAQLQQEGGREKLEASGLSTSQLNTFEEKGLTEQEEEVFNSGRKVFDKIIPMLVDVMGRVYNKDFTAIKNYFPMMADFKAMEELEIQSMFGDDVPIVALDRKILQEVKSPQKGFTEKRIGGDLPVQLNFLEVFKQYTSNAAYLITMGERLEYLNTLASTTEYKNAVGSFNQTEMKGWLDLMARRGGQAGVRSGALDTIRKNVGVAILGFKLSTIMIQPTALFDGAGKIGHYAFKGAMNVLIDPNWRAFMRNNFEEIKNRMAGDISYKEVLEDTASGKTIKKVAVKSFWGIRTVDGIVAAGVAAGAYEKFVIEKGGIVDFKNPDIEAILDAERIVRLTQGSGLFKDSPSATTRGRFSGNRAVDKMLFQFQTFLLTRFSLVSNDMVINGFRIGRTEEGLRIATFVAMALIAEVGLRRLAEEMIAGITGDDPEEDFTEEFWEKLGIETIRTVPFGSQIVSLTNYGSAPVPVISIIDNVSEATGRVFDGKGDAYKDMARAIIQWAGLVGGVPGTAQADQIIRKALKDKDKRKVRVF